jgi:tetratricopeptide (TPR) repeat protein
MGVRPEVDAAPLANTSNLLSQPTDHAALIARWQGYYDLAKQQRRSGDPKAEASLQRIIHHPEAPREFRRLALLELAHMASEKREFTKAQNLFADYTKEYSDHPSAPEIFLRQGLLYREMGAHELAIGKFYAVMSSALKLRLSEVEYYKRLVLQAQTEIADTYYLQGRHTDAAEFYGRLLKLNDTDLNRAVISYKLIRSLSGAGKLNETVGQAVQYLAAFTNAEVAEVRFLLADAYRKLGRKKEALEQVNALLTTQQELAREFPEQWIYWQQRTGNEIANQLYKEGDYLSALQVYRSLASLDNSPAWQMPIWYQMGLVYEKLKQPQRAVDIYTKLFAREAEATTNATPALSAIVEMARWRADHLRWVTNAETATRQFSSSVRHDELAAP